MNCARAGEILRETGPRDALDAGVLEHLEGCPACRKLAGEYRRLDADLAGLYASGFEPGRLEDALAGLQELPRRRAVRGGRLLAAAAALLLAVGGTWFALRGRDPGPGPDGARPGFNPRRLAISDSAPARFDDVEGARVAARAGSRITVTAPRRVNLAAGAALFKVAPGGGAFVVEVPDGAVSVPGTEFAVSVEGEVTRVAVRSGRVRLENVSGRLMLKGGQAGELARRPGDRSPAAPARLEHEGLSVAAETLWRPWAWLDAPERSERLEHLRGVLSREPYDPRLAARKLLAEAGEEGLRAAISWTTAKTPRLRLEAVLFLGRAPAGHAGAHGALRAAAGNRREQPGIRRVAERSLEALAERKASGSGGK
jgi:hypothetical protein